MPSSLMNLVLDFETKFQPGKGNYNLKELSIMEYVRDKRFEVLSIGISQERQGPNILPFIRNAPNIIELPNPENTRLIAHNCYFEGLILNEYYDWCPAQYVCTQALSMAVLPGLRKHDLDTVSKFLGHEGKTDKIRPEMTDDELSAYVLGDVEATLYVYDKLRDLLPPIEWRLMDRTIRWGAIPRLRVDELRLRRAIIAMEKEKETIISNGACPEDILASNVKFAEYLRKDGVDVPMKLSPRTGKMIPALAREDWGWKQMRAQHPEREPQWKARLAVKSSIHITRARRIAKVASWPLPMPLKYYGAHTGRWSGTDKVNPQNFPKKGELRKCLVAPPGFKIMVVDAAQIEMRVNAWLCGEKRSLDILRAGRDIYEEMARTLFTVITDGEVTEKQRFEGKTVELALGFQMGAEKYYVKQQGRVTRDEARQRVALYRQSHPRIVASWYYLQQRIPCMAQEGYSEKWGPIEFRNEGILLPNKMPLQYGNLRPKDDNWIYHQGTYLYGGKMLENIVQALARIITAGHLLKIQELDDVETVSMVHDEVISIVPDARAGKILHKALEIMREVPDWAEGLPLDAKGGYSREYSK